MKEDASKEINCKQCGCMFTTKGYNSKFCCKECRDNFYKEVNIDIKNNGTCLFCETIFNKYGSQKFCNKECREKYKLRQREENGFNAKYFVFERDDFRCVYCGHSSIEDNVYLVPDHVEPYYINKDNSLYNLVTSCVRCNSDKSGNRLSKEIYERIIKRNTQLMRGISEEKLKEVSEKLEKYFTITKNRN